MNFPIHVNKKKLWLNIRGTLISCIPVFIGLALFLFITFFKKDFIDGWMAGIVTAFALLFLQTCLFAMIGYNPFKKNCK